MDKKTLNRIRIGLDSELARLEAEVSEMEREGHEQLSDASGENNYRDHMADQGSATFARELDMSLEDNLRESLSDVRSALVRIENGTFGVCERCGGAIRPERLEVMPTATMCISCKEKEENR